MEGEGARAQTSLPAAEARRGSSVCVRRCQVWRLRVDLIEVRRGALRCEAFRLGRGGAHRGFLLKLVEERVRSYWRLVVAMSALLGGNEVPAGERSDIVLFGEYRAREPFPLCLARIPPPAEADYVGVGLVAIVHRPRRRVR